MKNKINTLLCFIMIVLSWSCNKLDVKPRQSLVVPSTLLDFQGLMDNTIALNDGFFSLSEISGDNYYVTPSTYNALTVVQDKQAYTWEGDIFKDVTFDADWNNSYIAVFYSNVVLDGLNSVAKNNSNQADFDNIKGQALFHRAYAFYWLATQFAPVYKQATAKTDLGIVLRLSSDLNIKSQRSTIQQSYDQIIGDLLLAKSLLQVTPLYKTRPSKAAAFAMLARVYLAQQDYRNALLNADSCLKLNNTLIDYNTVSQSAPYPFTPFNSEVIYHDQVQVLMLRSSRAILDSNLCNSYALNDLRKTLFLGSNGNNTYHFKGNYFGASNALFAGIATDEIYLIRAECNARLGNLNAAMDDYNTLLTNRYATGTYNSVTAGSTDDALSKILPERRKELLFRFLRWGDLRRLNLDPKYAITLNRTFNSLDYTLPPNDNRYTLSIPDYIIALNGIQQNPR